MKVRHDRHLTRENPTGRCSILRLAPIRTSSYGETMLLHLGARARQQVEHPPLAVRVPVDDTLGAGLQMAVYDLAGKALGCRCTGSGPWVKKGGARLRWTNHMDRGLARRDARGPLPRLPERQAQSPPLARFQARRSGAGRRRALRLSLDADFNAFCAMPPPRALPPASSRSPPSPFRVAHPRGTSRNKVVRSKITWPIAMHYGSPPIETVAREGSATGLSSAEGRSARQQEFAAQLNKPFWLQMVGTGFTTAWMLHQVASSPRDLAGDPCHEISTDDLIPSDPGGGYAHVPGPPVGVEPDEAAIAATAWSGGIACAARALPVSGPGMRTIYPWQGGRLERFHRGDSLFHEGVAGSARGRSPSGRSSTSAPCGPPSAVAKKGHREARNATSCGPSAPAPSSATMPDVGASSWCPWRHQQHGDTCPSTRIATPPSTWPEPRRARWRSPC